MAKYTVWHQKRDAYKEKHLMKYGGGSLMLWGRFAASGPGALKINEIMNFTKYQDISAKNLFASARKRRLGRRWTYNDSTNISQNKHRNGSVKTKSMFCRGLLSLRT